MLGDRGFLLKTLWGFHWPIHCLLKAQKNTLKSPGLGGWRGLVRSLGEEGSVKMAKGNPASFQVVRARGHLFSLDTKVWISLHDCFSEWKLLGSRKVAVWYGPLKKMSFLLVHCICLIVGSWYGWHKWCIQHMKRPLHVSRLRPPKSPEKSGMVE